MLTIPDGWRTRLSWASWSYPNRWLPEAVYEAGVLIGVLQNKPIKQYTLSANPAETSVPAVWQRIWAVLCKTWAFRSANPFWGIQKKRHTESGMYVSRGRSLWLFCSNGFLTPFWVHIWFHTLLKHIISEERGRGALWWRCGHCPQAIAFFGSSWAPNLSNGEMAWDSVGHYTPYFFIYY